MTNSRRRSLPPLLWAFTAAALALGSGAILRSTEMGVPLRVALALLPVLPMVGYGVALVRSIAAMDELQTRIQLEAAGLAGLVTVIGVMVAGLLTKSEVLPPWPLSKSWPWIWMTWGVGWVLGAMVAGRRYR